MGNGRKTTFLMLLACQCAVLMSWPTKGWSEPLSLDSLIELAVTSPPSVAGRIASIDAASEGINSARLQFFPNPSIASTKLDDQTATVLGLTQPIWSGGRLSANLENAKLKHELGLNALADSRQVLALKTISLYQLYLALFNKRASQNRSIERLNSLAGLIERRVNQGVSAEADALSVRSRLVQARSELAAIEAQLQVQLSQLSRITGIVVTEQEILIETVDTTAAREQSLDSWFGKAVENDPGLRSVRIQATVLEKEADVSASALWPAVSVRAEHQIGQYPGSAAAGRRVYLLVNYAPGSGLSAVSDRDATRARVRAAQQDIESAQREVLDKVQQAWSDLHTAAARLPDLVLSRRVSEDVFESSGRLFVTGRRSWFDLLNTVRELASNEQLEADVSAQELGAYYRLLTISGAGSWVAKESTP